VEQLEPLTNMDRIEHALEEGYRAAMDGQLAMKQFYAITTPASGDSFATIETTLTPLIAKLTSAHLFMQESREWFELAATIFKREKLEAESGD